MPFANESLPTLSLHSLHTFCSCRAFPNLDATANGHHFGARAPTRDIFGFFLMPRWRHGKVNVKSGVPSSSHRAPTPPNQVSTVHSGPSPRQSPRSAGCTPGVYGHSSPHSSLHSSVLLERCWGQPPIPAAEPKPLLPIPHGFILSHAAEI